jgi:hypothetical protein
MSSPSLLPAEEQGGAGKINDIKQDAKDKKGTLTNLFKKSQELAAKAAAEPEIVELLDDSQEGDQMEDVTPSAPEDKEAEAQPTEEKATAMELTAPTAEQAEPATEDTSGDQVNILKFKFLNFGRSILVLNDSVALLSKS